MLGQILNRRYRLIRVLGAGGFGQTYVAIDTQRAGEPPCVVKHLKPASQDQQFLKVARRLFETEVNTLRRLGEHACIPRLIDSFEDNQEFYLVQEYIDGEPLGDEIKRLGRLGEEPVIQLLRETLTILKFVHEHRVVHRDLKPDNLIRRRCDRKFCLIDFGAVKEIRTQMQSHEVTNLTVGIGTHGYMPSEQLAGKPRYSSDLFALGMTAIHALTGRAPTALPEEEASLDLRWQEYATVSPGLAILLNKLVRHYVYQRYQLAEDVLKDLDRLDELPQEVNLETIPQTFLPPPTVWQPNWRESLRGIVLATLVTSFLTLGFRQVGGFMPLELQAYDWLVSHRPDPGPDPRLLLVEITEADLKNQRRVTPSDEAIATVIDRLQSHDPVVIGLDLHRELPQPPGQQLLQKSLQASNVIAITKLGDSPTDRIPPPAGLPPERIGFNDLVPDADNTLRRNLYFASSDPTDPNAEIYTSFGLQIAFLYLKAQHNLESHESPQNPDFMQLGQATFKPLNKTFGGYQQIDDRGYQILLDYRSPQQVAQRVSLTDILDNDFDPAWVKNKIVLIGTTAYTSNDKFFTPYSGLGGANYTMLGVVVHAQMVSQFLTAALDGKRLPWAWPDSLEITWIVFCATTGGLLAWWVRRPSQLIWQLGGSTVAIAGISIGYFFLNAWVPVVAPVTAHLLCGSALITYRNYQQRRLQQRWQKQNF